MDFGSSQSDPHNLGGEPGVLCSLSGEDRPVGFGMKTEGRDIGVANREQKLGADRYEVGREN